MRISDWSSDVCSSDLARDSAAFRHSFRLASRLRPIQTNASRGWEPATERTATEPAMAMKKDLREARIQTGKDENVRPPHAYWMVAIACALFPLQVTLLPLQEALVVGIGSTHVVNSGPNSS